MAKKTRKQKVKAVQHRTREGVDSVVPNQTEPSTSHLAYQFRPKTVVPTHKKPVVPESATDQEVSRIIKKEIIVTVTLATIAIVALFILSKVI